MKQMIHMLSSKLGGLLDRCIFYMPFSRDLRLSAADAEIILQMVRECAAKRGLFLVQPEHILSFKLMVIEHLMHPDRQATARTLASLQSYFDTNARDLVDESDANFDTKFELVYTIGAQRSIELAPTRWVVIQEILTLVGRYAPEVKRALPTSIELQNTGDGRFPKLRILRDDAASKLLEMVAKHVVDHGLAAGLPLVSSKAALFTYFTKQDLTAEDIGCVEQGTFWVDSIKEIIMLIRGLLAGGILPFVLSSKRFRVNYGLDTVRQPATKLAVPYRFKDGPADRSDFSHPEVLILLSLLSHYYGGLSDEDMFDAFHHLSRSNQALAQYTLWVDTASSTLPDSFRQLSGVPIKDRGLCKDEVFPHLRHSKACIDYFLSHLVFPKSIKEFEKQLSASGWDLGAIKTHPTTGFSGTCDTQATLPLTVKHLDLPSQRHTNALVINFLLKDETTVELLPSRTNEITDAEQILKLVVKMTPQVRVVLDCGASILEQNNQQVARAWLKMSSNDIQAAVFFEDEELSVLDRSGRIQSFQTSPFATNLTLA
jgi:hypothetical protein